MLTRKCSAYALAAVVVALAVAAAAPAVAQPPEGASTAGLRIGMQPEEVTADPGETVEAEVYYELQEIAHRDLSWTLALREDVPMEGEDQGSDELQPVPATVETYPMPEAPEAVPMGGDATFPVTFEVPENATGEYTLDVIIEGEERKEGKEEWRPAKYEIKWVGFLTTDTASEAQEGADREAPAPMAPAAALAAAAAALLLARRKG